MTHSWDPSARKGEARIEDKSRRSAESFRRSRAPGARLGKPSGKRVAPALGQGVVLAGAVVASLSVASPSSTHRRAIQESFFPSGAFSRSNCLTAPSLARSISSCSKAPRRPEVPRSGRTCTTFGSARLTLHPPPCEAVWDRRTLLSGLHTLGRKRTAEWPRCRSRLRS